MLVGAMLVIGVLAVGLVAMLALRSATFSEAKVEARLHEPGVDTVVYAVPEGQDAAVLMAALARRGFTSVPDTKGGDERLIIECPDVTRAQVREIIEHVTRTGFEGTEMHVEHVRFEDEPA